jgi:hypothetical protein
LGGECDTHWGVEKSCENLIGKLEEKKPLVRPRRRWENWIKMGRREFGWNVVDWILWAQDRVWRRTHVNSVMNFRVLAPRNELGNYSVKVMCFMCLHMFIRFTRISETNTCLEFKKEVQMLVCL